jgi:hypothetical protein
MSINSNIADFLFKKNLGIVTSQPGVSYNDESSGNAKTKLFSSQLFSQTVPLDIPTDFTSPIQYVNANGTLSNTDNGLGLGTVQTSISYPYIQKVTRLKLTTVVNINTYRFNDPSTAGNINLLQNAIPFNYNPNLSRSYTYSLFAEKGSPYSLSLSNPIATSKYIIDTDAGYLYIVAADWSNNFGTCFVTFYRYNGTMGIPTNLGNFAGAYLQGTGAIAYGNSAGYTGQGVNAIAMGNLAGAYGQGTGSIAIGNLAGPTGMSANSIVLNASGTALHGTGPTGGFYVAPIASYKNASNPTGPFQLLAYGPDNQIVTVTGATGLNLSLSTPTVTYDSWLLANMIGAPPAVESLAIDNFTTTDVYITFSYPSQIYSGLSQSGLLPYINNMFVNLYNSSDTLTSLNGVTGSTGLQANTFGAGASNFIAQTTPVDPTNVVQCINVTKSAKPSGLGTYTTTKTPKTLKSYTIPYTSLTPGQLATFYMWYANNNPTKNVSSIQFTYKAAQNPTRVTGLTITPSETSQSITITFTGSSAIDSGDPLSTALVNYAISYNSIAGSNTRRYGGTKSIVVVNDPTIGPIGTTGGAQSQIITASIYPDTAYYVTVNASNTNLGTGSFTGSTGTSIQTTGPAPPAPQTSSSKLLSSNILPAKSVFGGSVSNLLKTKDNSQLLPSLTTPFNIHNTYESRGYTGPNALVNFTSNLWGFTGPNGVTGFTGPSASIYGFSGTYNYPDISNPSQQNGIKLSFSTPVDIKKDATDGTDGYYLKTDATVSIDSSKIVASSNQYTLCVTGTYSSTPANGAPASAATTFYYDGETGTNGTPSISSQPAISIASAVTGAVCGINVVTNISFNIGVTGVTGIGQYFYNAGDNGIISYAPNGPAGLTFTPQKETDLSNLTSGIGANGFNTPISFSRNPISLLGIASSQYYAGPVGVSVTPYNIDNKNGSAISSNTFPLIFDPLSITALQTQISIGTITNGNNNIIGTRVAPPNPNTIGNENVANPNNTLNNLTNGGTSFSSRLFDNTKSLLVSPYNYELLYTNGNYTNTTTIDYTGYLGNSVNYTSLGSLNNYRYATFAWKAEKLGSKPIVFTLNSDNIGTISIDSGIAKIGSNPIILFFRVEDATSLASLNDTTNASNAISTPWINGNLLNSLNITTAFGPGNYNSTIISFNGLNNITLATKSISFNVILANALAESTSSKTYIYCRIGIPTALSFSFSSITCTL